MNKAEVIVNEAIKADAAVTAAQASPLLQGMGHLMPEIFLAVIALALLIYGVFRGAKSEGQIRMGVMLSLAFSFYFIMKLPAETSIAMNGLVVVDSFVRLVKGLIAGAAILVIAASYPYFQHAEEGDQRRFEYPILLLLATIGLMLLVSANDLLSVYLGLELASLSMYVMAAFDRDNSRSTEAGIKYFILGSIASGMMLFGTSLIYAFTGTTDFAALGALFAGYEDTETAVSVGQLVGLVLLVIGFLFKVSAVPFHMWTPDVYEGAPTPVTAYFAAVPKLAVLALFARVMLQPFGELVEQWQQIIVLVSALTMILGAFAALPQRNIKRLLAYSSIGHVGYALMGLAAGTVAGVEGLLIYLAIYVAMNAGAFACIMLMRRRGRMVESIADLAGLYRTHPGMALALSIFMLSMAGIPPLAGFFGKMFVFLTALQSGLVVLAVIGVLTSVVAAYYYLRILKIMLFDEPHEALDSGMPLASRLVLLATGAFTVFYVVWPSPLLALVSEAARALAPS